MASWRQPMNETEREKAMRALVEQVPRKAHAELCAETPRLPDPLAIPWTELPPSQPDSALCQEWDFYRHEVGRLLAEGHENRFVLIKGRTIIGIWDSEGEATTVAFSEYPNDPCL